MLNKEEVLKQLSNVMDPDLNKDLVTLNMIKDIEISEKEVQFTVELTTPACPLKEKIKTDCEDAVRSIAGDQVDIIVKISSRVTTKRDDLNLLPGVKNIIAVASGKGGVGKSTVSVNLAIALQKTGAKVGIIDADIYGPSIPTMLGLQGQRPGVTQIDGKHYILPVEKFGLKVLSIGFLVDEKQAVVWRGPMVSSALRQFVTDCIWGDLDYLIIDLPPGTGDIHLTLVQTVPVTGAIVVTTPQQVSIADVKKALAMFNMPNINVPVIGIVENMSWFTPEELPDNKYHIFGKGGGQQIADEYKLPLLGQIPLVQSIREGGDSGTPSAVNANSILGKHFLDLAENSARHIAIRNAEHAETKRVEIVKG